MWSVGLIGQLTGSLFVSVRSQEAGQNGSLSASGTFKIDTFDNTGFGIQIGLTGWSPAELLNLHFKIKKLMLSTCLLHF